MAGAKLLLLPALEIANSLFSSSSSSSSSSGAEIATPRHRATPNAVRFLSSSSSSLCLRFSRPPRGISTASCLPYSSSSPKTSSVASTKLFVSGLSFRTTEESLTNAFQKFGELVEVNLVMDRIANRPRGFAFVRYSSDDESKKAIEEMHGKFLDGRVIFVEVAKSKSELRQDLKERPRIQ